MTKSAIPPLTQAEVDGLIDLEKQLKTVAAKVWDKHPNNPKNKIASK